jgi:hypothetical protein
LSDDLRAAIISCSRILGKLYALEGHPTTSRQPDGLIRPRQAQWCIPKGVAFHVTLDADDAPSKSPSLWAYYRWRVVRAGRQKNVDELVKLAACATRDYEIHAGLVKPSRHESHQTAVDELLSDHTGQAANEVAWRLDVPEKWVRRQRIVNGRDPEFGRPKVIDSRTAQVLALHKRGLKQRLIADEVGISQGRVSQILNGTR